jgi:hypothetical protein
MASCTGTLRNDTLIGMPGLDRLSGLAGGDHLAGLAGPDWFDGGIGSDTTYGRIDGHAGSRAGVTVWRAAPVPTGSTAGAATTSWTMVQAPPVLTAPTGRIGRSGEPAMMSSAAVPVT